MNANRLLALFVLIALSTTIAMADSIADTRFHITDPLDGSNSGIVITSNQFVTDSSGAFDLNEVYPGPPIYSLELVIPGQDIIGPLSCDSNVFLVLTIQPRGGNPGICYFNTTTSLGIAKFFPPDLNGSDDPNGFNCSWSDLDDCIGIQPGHGVDLGIPTSSPAAPNSTFELAANGASLLMAPEPGSGWLLLIGCVGLLVARRKTGIVPRFVSQRLP